MVRHHSTYCDCERCHPSEEILPFLVNPRTKQLPSPDTLYARRKQQECRVAEELRSWSEKDSRTTSNTPHRVTRSGRCAPMTVSSEAMTVVESILRRFKDRSGNFFTHLEIQIIFFWHTYQAMAGETMDAAVPMMITGVLTPYATDMELHARATKALHNEKDRDNQAQASEYNEMTRQLTANGAELRLWDALAPRTMFYFKAANFAVAQIPPLSASTPTSPVRGTLNGKPAQITQSFVVLEASPTPPNAMEVSQTDTRVEQLEEANCLLTERLFYLEDERAQFQQEWEIMGRKLNGSEAENRRLRNVLEASLQIFTEPWDALKDDYGS